MSDPPSVYGPCAQALATLGTPYALERAGSLWHSAGDDASAGACLVRATEGYFAQDPHGVPVARAARKALERVGDDLGLRLRALTPQVLQDRDPTGLDALERDARAAGALEVELRCVLMRVWLDTWRGAYAEGLALATELEERAAGAGMWELSAVALSRRAGLLEHTGDATGCHAALQDALDHATRSGDARTRAQVLSRLGEHLMARGAFEQAEPLVLEAEALYGATSRTSTSRRTHRLLLAELHRKRGRLEEARRIVAGVRAELAEVGQDRGLFAKLATLAEALCAMGAGEHDAARALLVGLHDTWARDRHPYVGVARIHLAHLDALDGAWERARGLVSDAPAFVPDPDLVDAFEELVTCAAPVDPGLSAALAEVAAPWRSWAARG